MRVVLRKVLQGNRTVPRNTACAVSTAAATHHEGFCAFGKNQDRAAPQRTVPQYKKKVEVISYLGATDKGATVTVIVHAEIP